MKQLKKRFAEEKEKLELEFDYVHKEYTLDQWFYEWVDIYKRPYLKETRANQFLGKYNASFGKRIGNRKLKNIRNVDIQYVINELQREGKASSTVRDALGCLSDCMETARMDGIISINSCFCIKVAWKPKSVSLEALTREEQRLLLKKANESWYRGICLHVVFNRS